MNKNRAPKKSKGIIHVLFVDDDSNLVIITKAILERLGYIVTSAYNSSEAIELIKENHDAFDVMITDYSMPGMNGIELTIEANKYLADKPIILYTGKAEFIDKQQIVQAGIAHIVCKPCRIRDLDVIIRKILNAKQKASLHTTAHSPSDIESRS